MSALQDFSFSFLLLHSSTAIQLLFLEISTKKTSVGDPILKLKLSESNISLWPKMHKLMLDVTYFRGTWSQIFYGGQNFFFHKRVVKTRVWVICRSWRLRQIAHTCGLVIHDVMRKPDQIIVLLYIFLNNLEKKTLPSEIAKDLEHYTYEGLGIYISRIWTRHDNCNIRCR